MNLVLLNVLRARDSSLAAQVRREAFGRIVEAYQDSAFVLAYSILGDRQQAEDTAMEAFLEAWRHIESVREPQAFSGWLRALVRSKATRRLRGAKSEARFEEALNLTEDGHSGASGSRLTLEQALSRLTNPQREALILSYIVGLTREEIAARMGCSLLTTKKRLAKALSHLRKESATMTNEEFKEAMPSGTDAFRNRALLLAGQFAELLAGKKPILSALDDCILRAEGGPVGAAFQEMRAQVVEGKPMAEAMRKHPDVFSLTDSEAVYVGEEMGFLDDVLKRMAEGQSLCASALRREYAARVKLDQLRPAMGR